MCKISLIFTLEIEGNHIEELISDTAASTLTQRYSINEKAFAILELLRSSMSEPFITELKLLKS
uniref:Uncharacterized protein n=1 Tax=Arundo donax TaxID=35708 RepID=A0A0A9EX92_ARUDO